MNRLFHQCTNNGSSLLYEDKPNRAPLKQIYIKLPKIKDMRTITSYIRAQSHGYSTNWPVSNCYIKIHYWISTCWFHDFDKSNKEIIVEIVRSNKQMLVKSGDIPF